MTDRPEIVSSFRCSCCAGDADPGLAGPREPSRASRRALLVGTAAVVLGGGVLARRRPSAAAVGAPVPATTVADPGAAAVAATPPPIEGAATVAAPAERLGLEPDLLFPIGPEPRCYVLDNYGDARSGGRRHEGIDILADVGQDVYAVVDGTLVGQTDASASLSGNSWGLTADDGVYYFFAHLSAFAEGLQVGDRVRRGQVIGYVGDTGNPGPGNYHLHFEVHPGGLRAAPVDPLPLLTVPDVCTVW
ncbi:MAG: M23 family metallopeptidase [Acidimicrobiaceae bacterium]|nr:M23 family metallopeptidase [Acidimicrobiaceae bacterium]